MAAALPDETLPTIARSLLIEEFGTPIVIKRSANATIAKIKLIAGPAMTIAARCGRGL